MRPDVPMRGGACPEAPGGQGAGVDVWAVRLDAGAGPDAASLLSDDERARAARYRDPAAGRRFACGRAAVRQVLAACVGGRPEDIAFRYAPGGKPALGGRWDGAGWEFSVSHSADLLLVAVGREARLGIDVEALRPLAAADGVAGFCLSAAERAEHRRLPGEARAAALLRAWTCKEAWAKAEGLGLHRPLRDVEVALLGGGSARVVRVDGSAPPDGWRLWAWSPLPGFVAALVAAGGTGPVRLARFGGPEAGPEGWGGGTAGPGEGPPPDRPAVGGRGSWTP